MRTNEEMFAELDAFIESVGNSPSEMIAILHTAQGIFGYLPMKVQKHIADRIGVNVSQVYGVVTFYSFFTMQPKGENVISICLGTACFVKGSGKLLEACENYLGIQFVHVIPFSTRILNIITCPTAICIMNLIGITFQKKNYFCLFLYGMCFPGFFAYC